VAPDTASTSWQSWLREQVRNGADLGEATLALRRNGIPVPEIAAAFEALRPRDSALASGRLEPPPLLTNPPAALRRADVAGFDLYTLDGFLTPAHCARLAALADDHLAPSPLSGAYGDNAFRTSRTCVLAHLDHPEARAIDDLVCRTLGIRADYGEAIQAQRYDVGQQFKAHVDYFMPGSQEYLRFAELRGNRTWTFMVYLNEGMVGGGTHFTEVGHTVTPKTGLALLWNNLHPDGSPNPLTRHAGEPVTRGHKVILTKWFRVRGNGPLFVD